MNPCSMKMEALTEAFLVGRLSERDFLREARRHGTVVGLVMCAVLVGMFAVGALIMHVAGVIALESGPTFEGIFALLGELTGFVVFAWQLARWAAARQARWVIGMRQ